MPAAKKSEPEFSNSLSSLASLLDEHWKRREAEDAKEQAELQQQFKRVDAQLKSAGQRIPELEEAVKQLKSANQRISDLEKEIEERKEDEQVVEAVQTWAKKKL